MSVAKREAALLVAVLLERCAALVSEMTRIAPPREITQMGAAGRFFPSRGHGPSASSGTWQNVVTRACILQSAADGHCSATATSVQRCSAPGLRRLCDGFLRSSGAGPEAKSPRSWGSADQGSQPTQPLAIGEHVPFRAHSITLAGQMGIEDLDGAVYVDSSVVPALWTAARETFGRAHRADAFGRAAPLLCTWTGTQEPDGLPHCREGGKATNKTSVLLAGGRMDGNATRSPLAAFP